MCVHIRPSNMSFSNSRTNNEYQWFVGDIWYKCHKRSIFFLISPNFNVLLSREFLCATMKYCCGIYGSKSYHSHINYILAKWLPATKILRISSLQRAVHLRDYKIYLSPNFAFQVSFPRKILATSHWRRYCFTWWKAKFWVFLQQENPELIN